MYVRNENAIYRLNFDLTGIETNHSKERVGETSQFQKRKEEMEEN